jgi:hypothetical protein
MSEQRRPMTPIDSPPRPQTHGDGSARIQERYTRKGVKSHDEVTPPTTRSNASLSAYSATSRRPQPKSLDSEKASVRKRPSTVHTPKFRDMISRLQDESSEDIRMRTTGRLRTLQLASSESNASDDAESNEFGEEEIHFMSSGSGEDEKATFKSYESHHPENIQKDSGFYQGFNSDMKGAKAKYYAVKRGRRPGIYRTWEECERQVEGFSHCEFKSFKSEWEAQRYLWASTQTFDDRLAYSFGEDPNDVGVHNGLPYDRAPYSDHSAPVEAVERTNAVQPMHSAVQQRVESVERNVERNHAVYPMQSTVQQRVESVERNDAVNPMPNTVQRRNVTQRKSQGRARDRVSMGEPSVPVEFLVARKFKPREIDLGYKADATTPPLAQRSIASVEDEDTSLHVPSVSHFPADIARLWGERSVIELDMQSALEVGDEHGYRTGETRHRQLSEYMASLMLGPAPGANGLSSTKKHQPTSLADSRNYNQDAQSSSSDSTTDWRYDGSSFVIYIDTSDTVFPWVVWANMPVSLLIPAVVNLLNRSHRFVPPESVTLLHHGREMDAVHDCLSDYPVLPDDVVTVQITFPRGGLVVDRTPHKGKKGKKIYEQRECIVKGCSGQTTFPLCGICYHSLVSGKKATMELDNGWGNATFSTETNSITYPPGVPRDIIPKPKKAQ